MRVHELAKELGVESKKLIAEIKKLGAEVKSHMSLVDEDVVAQLRGKQGGISAARKHAPAAKPSVFKQTVAGGDVPASEKPSPVAEKKKQQPGPAQRDFREDSRVTSYTPPPKPEPAVKVEAVPSPPPAPAGPRIVRIQFPITVGNLASTVGMKISELIKVLMGIGIFANVNQLLNQEIVDSLAREIGVKFEKLAGESEKLLQRAEEVTDPSRLKPRPPIVTIMGHVDHGKTSLLDAIRKTDVAGKEKGFITQHIGAYGVDIPGKGHVTFLDTPGHEAFTAMRARGANLTDVVVLVVAADDGIMPQTVEAINHAREANCPIIVALNKIDLPHANPAKVLGELQKMGLVPEEWGGKTICVKASAKTGQGLENLLEMLLLEAEILELKADPECLASGTVVESHLSKGSGPVATVIVQNGTLRVGDIIVCGPYRGRVRSLKNDRGKNIKEAGPAYSAEVSGLNGSPVAGKKFLVVDDERVARRLTEQRILEKREREMRGAAKHLFLEDLYHQISEGNFKELKMIIKGDVQGSVEAFRQSLEKLGGDQCQIRVIHGGVGGINESDVMLAAASDAVILGFHVKADSKSQKLAEEEGVDIRFYSIIYEAVEDVRKAMEGLLEPTYKEIQEGRAQIRKIFTSAKVGTIGGAMVIKGRIMRSHPVRLIRNQVVLFEGKLSSLKRFKDDVREVAQGYECGVAFAGFNDLAEGDIVESYRLEKIAAKL
jgi:translation initiation factor IF-2